MPCIATAVTIPASSSNRSARVRTQRATSQHTSTQQNGSTVDVASTCPEASSWKESAYAAAVVTWALVPPPNSRAISAASTIPPAVSSIGSTRSATTDPGNTASDNQASAGSSHGLSA